MTIPIPAEEEHDGESEKKEGREDKGKKEKKKKEKKEKGEKKENKDNGECRGAAWRWGEEEKQEVRTEVDLTWQTT